LKLLAGLFALMLAIGLASLWFWRSSREPSPCESHEMARSLAPDGRVRADVFEVRCPGAVTTHVALLPADRPVEARSDVFVGLGAVPVRVFWNGERELRIESPAERVLVEETRWRDVQVRILRP
jgi:hypothetical protein